MRTRALLKSLYVQVLLGIAAGVILGFVAPEQGAAMRPLGDGFIKLVKMLIAPIVFATVAVVIGLLVVNLVQPGRGLTIDPAALDMKAVASYASASKGLTTTDFILN